MATRAQPPATWPVLGAALLFVALLWGGIVAAIEYLDRLHVREAHVETAQLAEVFALQTEQFLQSVEISLNQLARRIEARPITQEAVTPLMHQERHSLPAYLDFVLTDATGQGLAGTPFDYPAGISFADREYFQAHREGRAKGIHLAAPIQARTQRRLTLLPLSLALRNGDGDLTGVLAATIDTRILAEQYARIPLGSDGLVVLVRTDPLQIVARTPDHDAWFGRAVTGHPMFAGLERDERAGTIEAAAADGVERIASWRSIGRYPLAIFVGISRAELEARQAGARATLWIGGIVATLLAFLLATALMRTRQQQAALLAAQEELSSSHEAHAQALARLAASLQRAQAVAKVGSWELDIPANRLDWSEETYRIFGVTSGTPLNYEAFLACVHPDDRAAVDAAWQAALKGAPYDIVHRIVVGGQIKWVRERAELRFDDTGALHYGLGTVQDVTETILIQEELAAAKEVAEAASRAKSAFLANMSHEIRTPMNAVLGLTQLVLDSPLPDESRQMLEHALAAGRKMLGLLNDLLDYSKLEAERIALERLPFSPRVLIEDIARLFAGQLAEKDLQLICDVDPQLPAEILGDPHRIEQVLNNLISNAIKFTEKGEIRLAARRLPAKDDQPERIEFTVADTGIGFDMADAARLFDPFTQADESITRRYGGTGLGLAISRRLATLMGGTLAAESAPNAGATFRLTLPLDVAVETSDADVASSCAALPPPAEKMESVPLDPALTSLLDRLRPYLVARELPPDELTAELAVQAERHPPLKGLMRDLDRFAYHSALSTLDALHARKTPDS